MKPTWDEGELRDKLRGQMGEVAFVELAMAIATGRVYPVTSEPSAMLRAAGR